MPFAVTKSIPLSSLPLGTSTSSGLAVSPSTTGPWSGPADLTDKSTYSEENILGFISLELLRGTKILGMCRFGSHWLNGSAHPADSLPYIEKAKDLDVLLLVSDYQKVKDFLTPLGFYDTLESIKESSPLDFMSFRYGWLNVTLTDSKDHFERVQEAQAIVEKFNLQEKYQRILIFEQIVRGVEIIKPAELVDFITGKHTLEELIKAKRIIVPYDIKKKGNNYSF